MKKYLFLILLFALNAQGAALDVLLKNGALKGAAYSYYAKYVGGEEILSVNKNLRLVPGSAAKLFVAAAALDKLGAEHRFETRFYFDKKNNLYIRGGGDPVFGFNDLAAVKTALKGRKIKEVFVDNSLFTGPEIAPKTTWEDAANYYSAPAEAVNINDNSYEACFLEGLQITPEIKGQKFRNETTLSPAANMRGRDVYAYYEPSGEIVFRGAFNPLSSARPCIKGAMPGAPLFFGRQFGGKVTVLNTSVDYAPKTLVYTHFSPPLNEIIERMNLKSVNMYAEVLLKHLCAEGSARCGLEAEKKYLKTLGLDTEEFNLKDASGMSRENLITTELFVNFLEKQPFKEGFKTGTMTGVKAHAGYALDKKGRKIVFVFITNNFLAETAQVNALHLELLESIK